jgi:hypothetical protein
MRLQQLAILAGVAFPVWAGTPNTGMADPAALAAAYDRFAAGLPPGGEYVLALGDLRGLTSETFNAGGRVRINVATGGVISNVRGLPLDGSFDLWLVDNLPQASTLADSQDIAMNVGTYQVAAGRHTLSLMLGPDAFAGFLPDRAFVVRSGQSDPEGFVLTGAASLFDRLFRRQVRFVDDAGAALGFDPAAPGREADFAKLVAQGRRLFLEERFSGNGRTCGTCHVESNNFTIDPEFIATLPASDPLFVAETDPALATLERPALMRQFGLILENVDGLDDLANKFTLRATQPVLALANSMVRPLASFGLDFTTNGRNADPPERLGWGNDGLPLRDFAIGAVVQHATRSLARVPGTDVRIPTDEELDAMAGYQLALGRQEDFDLPSLVLKSPLAGTGKTLYLDTGTLFEFGHKNCNACHFNGGGTAGFAFIPGTRLDTMPAGFNMAAPTNANETPVALALGAALPPDGGFGVLPLAVGGFGNTDDLPPPFFHVEPEEFNAPPLVESADTAPFFHNHTVKTLEEAVAFYGTPAFQSPARSIGAVLIPVTISSDPRDAEVQAIAAMLRVLNALENIRSSINLAERGRAMSSASDARGLAGLALAETLDAYQVISEGAFADTVEPGILDARTHLLEAKALLTAISHAAPAAVPNLLRQAAARLRASRAALADPATLPPSFRN